MRHLQKKPRLPKTSGSDSVTFEHLKDTSHIPQIVGLAQEAHAETRLGHVAFDAEKTAKIAAEAIADPNRHGIFMALKATRPIGFAYASVGGFHIGTGYRIAAIHNINVSQSVRHGLAGGRAALGLMRGIESWAKARQANEILLHVTSGVDLARSHKWAKRLGFTFIGGNYAKTV